MSPREKKLLISFALAGFVILNILGYNFAQSKRLQVDTQRQEAIAKLATAETFRENSAQVTDQMEWLTAHEPQPAANQEVQTSLQQLAEREARSSGLTIKTQKPLPTDVSGTHYHRAKLQITVSGSEEALFRWLDRLNTPEQFRIASQIRLSPNTTDDTKIDCAATIEQWFVPTTTSTL
jgi:Type II secretion system (T2SS), protein M subtype b